jgi:long-chain acyl-CoA synthetase
MAETALAAFLARVRSDGPADALVTLAAGGAPADERLSWDAWAERSRAFAAALVAADHRPGEVVAVLAGNRAEWPIAEIGILMAGCVSAGVYPTSAPGQLRQLLRDCGATAIVVDTAGQLAKLREVRADLPALRTVIGVDDDGGCTGWDAFLARGRAGLAAGGTGEIERRIAAARGDDTAILIYTSGSTGEPKGAEITHRALVASTESIRATLGLTARDSSLSFLPFCHAAERMFGLHTRIACGMTAGLVAEHRRLWDAARAFRPTLFGGLPRFFEKAADTLRAERAAAAGEERALWERTLFTGREVSRLRRGHLPVPAELEAAWRGEGAPVLERARDLFGGAMRLATSGGASLPVRVVEFLDALGVTVLGGYGMTEHLCVAFNRPDRYAFDTVGPPMPGAEIRIAGDGEILIRRGPGTFAGYRGRPGETRAAFTADGEWLRTGDLGTVGSDGALRLTGRKKELIALSNGKKIAPLIVESALTADAWIEQAMLYGEGRAFASALLVLRRQTLEAWARAHGRDPDDPSLLDDRALIAAVAAAVERVNAGFSTPERVRRFALLSSPFAGEELTPTLKLRRATITDRHRDRLDALYHES